MNQDNSNDNLDKIEKAEGQLEPQAAPSEFQRQPIQVTITDIELEKIQKEAAECKDKYLRLLAESENARKRMQKERQELIQFAVQNIIVDFLEPIDHFENALKFAEQTSDEVKHWAQGFKMILGQFKDVLTNNNVSSFESVGKSFDPHWHEAIEAVTTTEHPPGTVVNETLRGYKMGEKIMRPARVKVAKAPPSPKPISGSKQEKEETKVEDVQSK